MGEKEDIKPPQLMEKKFNILAQFSDVKAAEDGNVYVEGYASTFNEDLDGETITKDAFAETLDDYKMNPIVLANHTNTVESVVGKTVDAKVDNNGLWVRVQLSNSQDSFTQMVRSKVQEGLLRAFSIGGLFQYDYPKIKKVKLLEISIVPIPANSQSLFSMAKAWKGLQLEEKQQEEEENDVLDSDGQDVEESGELLDGTTEETPDNSAISTDFREEALKRLTQIYLIKKGN